MTPTQAIDLCEYIKKLWPLVNDPNRGWTTERFEIMYRQLIRFDRESAEAIIQAQACEKGRAHTPDMPNLLTRMRVAADAEARRLGPVREDATGEQVELRSFAYWKRWHDDPEKCDAIVSSMNEHEPHSGDNFAVGARARWGNEYGRVSA